MASSSAGYQATEQAVSPPSPTAQRSDTHKMSVQASTLQSPRRRLRASSCEGVIGVGPAAAWQRGRRTAASQAPTLLKEQPHSSFT